MRRIRVGRGRILTDEQLIAGQQLASERVHSMAVGVFVV
jgi:hypothetical protein